MEHTCITILTIKSVCPFTMLGNTQILGDNVRWVIFPTSRVLKTTKFGIPIALWKKLQTPRPYDKVVAAF